VRRPNSSMTTEQIRQAKKLIGTMPRDEIAETIGVSVASLKRAFRGTRICFFNKHVANPDRVKQVTKFYERHGRAETQKAFPEINVRSIVERYKLFRPRTIRWSEGQIIELARMGGVITYESQAKYFKRPGANAGSIKSAWTKKFKIAGGSINGMSHHIARQIVDNDCPFVTTRFWEQRKASGNYGRRLYLWVDMEKHLQPDIPNFIRDAVVSLAKFQRWLHQRKNPRLAIGRLIEVREKR
jgi:hypothetical protein